MADSIRNALADYIPWILAFHIIFVITWMAGMLYLPRLFVYHTQTKPGSEGSERFKVMERKLLRGIVNPSMVAVWILGPTLAWLTGAYLDCLAADQIRAGDGHERHTRLSGALLAGFRGRPQYPLRTFLPDRERIPGSSDDCSSSSWPWLSHFHDPHLSSRQARRARSRPSPRARAARWRGKIAVAA